MKRTTFLSMAAVLAVVSAQAATMIPDYTQGAASPLSSDNGGAGSILFVDYGSLGGNDFTDTDGYSDNFTILIDGAGQWRVGDTIEVTGLAVPVHAITTNGTMTFDVLQGSGGIGESGAGGLASIGAETASYTNSGDTSVMYVNFDNPVSFTVDTNTFKFGINIANSGQLRIKAQPGFPVTRYNRVNGDFWAGMQVSVAGNVSAVPVTTNRAPEFSSDPFSKGKTYTDTPVSDTLSDVVSDPDNDQPVYELLSFSGPGPAWLGLDGSSITGTPQAVNIGTNEWLVQAADIYGGTNTATMTIVVESSVGNLIPSYTVGSGLLSPNGETLFVDTAALGGSQNLNDSDGFAAWFTVRIPGSNYWEIGDTVEITGMAYALRGGTANGTMTLDVREAFGGTGDSGSGGLNSLGTTTATFTGNGSTDTYYVNFDSPVTFVVTTNSQDIGINIQNSGTIQLKADASFPVARYNYINGAPQSTSMRVSVAGNVISGVPLYNQWEEAYGVTNGPAGDDDNDGLSNIREYGLGGNPTNGFVDAILPEFGPGASGLEYVHAQRKDDTNIVYYLDLATDLVFPSWTNEGYSVIGTNVTAGDFDYVTNLIDTTEAAKFIQLEIEQTP